MRRRRGTAAAMRRRLAAYVKSYLSFPTLVLKMSSFHHDGLGTNTGKALKKDPFSQVEKEGSPLLFFLLVNTGLVRKSAIFAMPFTIML